MAGDFDGDGKSDITIYRPSSGVCNSAFVLVQLQQLLDAVSGAACRATLRSRRISTATVKPT